MEDFDMFWRAYPRKVAKGDARKAWIQTARIRPAVDKLLESIDAACRSEQWMRDGGQYVPYPATWLRGERWDDEHVVVLKPKLPLATITQLPPPPTEEEKARVRELMKSVRLNRVA